MVVGQIPESVDLLVVGGGPGGYTAAIRAAQLGRGVVLVDRGPGGAAGGEGGLGGTCLNVGCIPSKALIEAAELRHRCAKFSGAGLSAPESFDMAAWQDWKSGVVAQLSRGVSGLVGTAGVSVITGELRFTRRNQAVVEKTDGNAVFLQFSDVIIATGSRPGALPGLVVDGVAVHDSTTLLDLRDQPDSVVVIGGGTIGLELGCALSKLGTDVTVVEALPDILEFAEPGIRRAAKAGLAELGVELLTGARFDSFADGVVTVSQAARPPAESSAETPAASLAQPPVDHSPLEQPGERPGKLLADHSADEASLDDSAVEAVAGIAGSAGTNDSAGEAPAGTRRLAASAVLVATGRRPNTDDLGLEQLGSAVRVSASGHIEVGADCLAKPHVAAIGDAVAGPALAHKATAQAVVAAEALCGEPAAFDPAAIPAVVFSDPEIAVAGMTLAQASAQGIDARAVELPLAASGRAATMGIGTLGDGTMGGGRGGLAVLVAEAETGVVLGVQLAGPHASELIGQAVLAIEMAATLEDLAQTIMPHPTLSEQLHDAAHVWLGTPLAVPGKPGNGRPR